MTATTTPRLSLGPIAYYWPKAQVHDFYAMVAASPVDIVYLGETICAKRNQLRWEDWLDIAARLRAAGKEVVLSTLALLAADGCKRWVLPVELTREALAEMQRLRPANVETEVFAYGRLPLAYSARCFTARAVNLPKDDCRDACLEHPDGLVVETQDDNRFLALNGIQTQSARSMNLLPALDELRALDVDILRISPQAEHMDQVIDVFQRVLTGELAPADAAEPLARLMPTGPCDGYWHGAAGMDALAAA
jgi:collagenase-like PrtC family protease